MGRSDVEFHGRSGRSIVVLVDSRSSQKRVGVMRSNNPFAKDLEEEFQEELKASRSDTTEVQEVPEIHFESNHRSHQLPSELSIPEAPPAYSEVDPHPSPSLPPQGLLLQTTSAIRHTQSQDEQPPPMPMRPAQYNLQEPPRPQADLYSAPASAAHGKTSIPLNKSYNEGYSSVTTSQQLPPSLPPRAASSPSLPPRPLDIYAPPPRPNRSSVYPRRTGATYNKAEGWRP